MNVENNNSLITNVKASYGEDLRRFSFSGNSFQLLEKQLCQIFGMSAPLKVSYLDDENEWITVDTDRELLCAIQAASPNKSLRLAVAPKGNPSAPALMEDKKNNTNLPQSPFFNPMQTNMVMEIPMGSWNPTYPVTPSDYPSYPAPPGFPTYPVTPSGYPSYPAPSNFPTSPATPSYPTSEGKFCGRKAGKHDKLKMKSKLRVVKDVTIEEGTVMLPSQQFVKTWRIRNESNIPWENCVLCFKKGEQMTSTGSFPVPTVLAGQEIEISIPMVAPTMKGKYVSVWKMTTRDGIKFGQGLKVKIRVKGKGESSSSSDEEQKCDWATLQRQYAVQLNYLAEMGFNNRKKNLKLLMKFGGNVEPVMNKLLKKANKGH